MATSRRDFLRNSACALGGMALASSVESFGAISALVPQTAAYLVATSSQYDIQR